MSDNLHAVIGQLFVENLKLRERINALVQEVEALKSKDGGTDDSE
ncbi:MAG: hypothetical protein ACE5F3_09100 [Mariprofundaceae bacterium]